MSRPPARLPGAAPEPADDLSIPVLTERLGLPPLEFDTTLPLIETTGQNLEPMLEGLTALPEPPVPVAPGGNTANLHPIAALPFPPIAVPEVNPPAAATPSFAPPIPPPPAPVPPAPVALATSAAMGLPAGVAARSAPVPAATPLAPPAPVPAPAALPASPADAARAAAGGQHWGRIEVELRSSILRQITEQLPREIDGIVQGRMQPAIDRLLTSLAEEIHLAVTASLGDIVERAVRAELERMRNTNRG